MLDAAGTLFACHGVDAVSLRDIAAQADVDIAVIRRYVGTREELVFAVFDDLSEQLARDVIDHPLSAQGHGPETVMGKWARIAGALAIAGRTLAGRPGFNPVTAMAKAIENGYGLDAGAARLRAAQVVASALGWRIFEDYVVAAGELEDMPLDTLRDELARSLRRLGATPWPSPPDPPARTR